jgi:hypothetical protein
LEIVKKIKVHEFMKIGPNMSYKNKVIVSGLKF